MWATEILTPVKAGSTDDHYTQRWSRNLQPRDMSIGYVDLPVIGRCHVHLPDYLIVSQAGRVIAVLDGTDWAITPVHGDSDQEASRE